MTATLPLACIFSLIRPPSIQFETAMLQIAPVNKDKCPYVLNDVRFQLYTRHNPTSPHILMVDDDESLFSSSIDFNDDTVFIFLAFMESPDVGSALWLREALTVQGDRNIITVNSERLMAGPWYVEAARNTWYTGRIAAMFIDFLVSRGLKLSRTHLVGHSLGSQSAGVAGGSLQSGRVSHITGLDPALPLFSKVPLEQRLDPSDAEFVDVIHTDAGIFGFNQLVGDVDFFPNGGTSPQPGCELSAVLPQQLLLNDFFCSHWRSYMFYAESILRPHSFLATRCRSQRDYKNGYCDGEPSTHMGYGVNRTTWVSTGTNKTKEEEYYVFHLRGNEPVQTDIPSKISNKAVNNVERRVNNVEKKKEKLDFETKIQKLPSVNDESFFSMQFNPIHILMKKNNKVDQISKLIPLKKTNIPKATKSRQRRFASFLKREDNNNLIKILDFFVKNRKNIIPVISVIREINTLVKTTTGELNHMIKEQNNYIGTTATLPPTTYNIQFNEDSKLMAFLKKIFGLGKERVSLVT